MVRMHRPLIKALDVWRKEAEITRPEATRQLVMWALAQTDVPVELVRDAREAEELRR